MQNLILLHSPDKSLGKGGGIFHLMLLRFLFCPIVFIWLLVQKKDCVEMQYYTLRSSLSSYIILYVGWADVFTTS